MGKKYKPGDRVVVQSTGQSGMVQKTAQHIEQAYGEQITTVIYRVLLDDGSVEKFKFDELTSADE